jgi:myb-related protein
MKAKKEGKNEEEDPDSMMDDDSDSSSSQDLINYVKENAELVALNSENNMRLQIKKRWWTPEEDEKLKTLVQQQGPKNWKKIASYFEDRTDVQCLHRWQKVLNPNLVKGPWTKEEDETVMRLVLKYGPKNWSNLAKHLPGRIGKQCRERYFNYNYMYEWTHLLSHELPLKIIDFYQFSLINFFFFRFFNF